MIIFIDTLLILIETELWFYGPLEKNRSFDRHSSKPILSIILKKLNLTQQINQ